MPIAPRVLSDEPAAGRLPALEAHLLFAAISRAGLPLMRHRFGEAGPLWVRLLVAAIRSHQEAGNAAMVCDLAQWLRGTSVSLPPFARLGQEAQRAFDEGDALVSRRGPRRKPAAPPRPGRARSAPNSGAGWAWPAG
ncbi:hypothetical protein GCM10027294_49760 [Marinactinospora endophytica]